MTLTGSIMTKFSINGIDKIVELDGDTPLLWVIRDELKMTGTKFGCGAGLCGACTVHINGSPSRSCMTPLSAVSGTEIRTIEGIRPTDETWHPVQQAWIEAAVPQCGYCQSGQIMSAVALLENTPNPTNADIDKALSGNICRCGTYPRIRKAIHRAAKLVNIAADTDKKPQGQV